MCLFVRFLTPPSQLGSRLSKLDLLFMNAFCSQEHFAVLQLLVGTSLFSILFFKNMVGGGSRRAKLRQKGIVVDLLSLPPK